MSSKYLLFSILTASLLSPDKIGTRGNQYKDGVCEVKIFCGQSFRKINAVFRGPNNYDFLFVDDIYVISGETGEKALIFRLFEGVKEVDAATYSRKQQKIFLVKGQVIWEFSKNYKKIKNSPSTFNIGPRYTRISLLPIHYGNYEIILLIKNLKYWLFFPIWSRSKNKSVGFKIRRIFTRIPYPLDAAFSDGRKFAYFLSGNKYTRQQINNKGSVTGYINNGSILRCGPPHYLPGCGE